MSDCTTQHAIIQVERGNVMEGCHENASTTIAHSATESALSSFSFLAPLCLFASRGEPETWPLSNVARA